MKKLLLSVFLALALCGPGIAADVPVLANQATASKRTVCFFLVDASDLSTPETGEAGGQPQISVDVGAWTDTGIGTLSAISSGTNGEYCAVVTQATVATTGVTIRTRYKSANTAEARGDTIRTVADDPDIAKPYAVRASTAFEWPMRFTTSSGAAVTSGTPACTRGIDTIATASFAATTNAASAVTSLGFSELTLSTTDTAASYYVVLRCTLLGANDYFTTFKIQAP